jgi:hypothetical protein
MLQQDNERSALLSRSCNTLSRSDLRDYEEWRVNGSVMRSEVQLDK